MFDLKNKIRKIGAGFMAGLCAFSMLGTNLSSGISAGAANTITTENSAFPNADEVIAKAATLLGSPYGWGFKGYTGVYYQGSYSPLSLDYVRNQGVDCSGLIYYTLTHLGYKTSGFSWNNPVPVDTISLLTECANNGDVFSCYKLGQLYLNGEIVMQDLDKAEKYLFSAEDNEFTRYALGKLYLQKEKYNIQKAISYFEKSADKNMWASYQLGRLYLFGTEDIQKDKEKAMKYLNLSAEQGNEYAQNILDNQKKFENEMLASTILSLFVNLSRCIEDDYHHKFQSGRKMIDSKLRKMIQEKNHALGMKEDLSQQQY